jgi:hypothetical protein
MNKWQVRALYAQGLLGFAQALLILRGRLTLNQSHGLFGTATAMEFLESVSPLNATYRRCGTWQTNCGIRRD